MKRAFGVRCTISTSSRSAPPRRTTTVAAWRGAVGSPLSLRIVPGSGPCVIAGSLICAAMSTETARQWICESCGFIYDPAEGDPDGGIPAGTAFEDIPTDWYCPVCGARKADFSPYEG